MKKTKKNKLLFGIISIVAVFLFAYFIIQRSFVAYRYKFTILPLPYSVLPEEYKIDLTVLGDKVTVLKVTDKSILFKNPESIKIARVEFEKYFFNLEIIESKKPNTFRIYFENILYEDSFEKNGIVVDLKFSEYNVPDNTEINPTISFSFRIGKRNYFGFMNAMGGNEYYNFYRKGDKINITQIEVVKKLISSFIIAN